MKLIKKSAHVFERFNNYLFWLAGILCVVGWFCDCFEIVMRYFLNRPTAFTVEIGENIIVWVTFLCAAWILHKDAHIKMDFVIVRLSPRTQMIINSLTSLVCAIVCLGIGWYGVLVVEEQFQKGLIFSTSLELPRGPLYVVIPVGFFMLFIQFLRRTYGYLVCRGLPRAIDISDKSIKLNE